MMAVTLLLVVLGITLVILISRSRDEIRSLGNVIETLVRETHHLKNEITTLRNDVQDIADTQWQRSGDAPAPTPPTPAAMTPEPEILPPTAIAPEQPNVNAPLFTSRATIKEIQNITEPGAVSPDDQAAELYEPTIIDYPKYVPIPKIIEQEYVPPPPAGTWWDNWLSNNPDLEKFIGENLINKIGIAVLVLGIAFFVKYAIDQNWINEVGRVCIGLLCGGILTGLAHYLRNSYRSFSSVLAGGGIAVFYFTIAFAFHQYHLMSQAAAFAIMVVITAFAVALAVLYDKIELAIIAAIGGFVTPFMVSTGDGNYVILFTYLIILNIGMLALAWFKRWPVLNIIALFFTEVIYGSWLTLTVTEHKPVSYPIALLFATAFYLLFLGMNMINQVRNRHQFKPFDFFIILFISSSYYAAGMQVLHLWNDGAYQGLFTLAIGVINLALAAYIYRQGRADRNLLVLLIGLTLTFITLTIPIQLHGHAITLFWSAEIVLLYWLSLYSGIKLFRYSSALLTLFTLVSLFMDWNNVSAANNLRINIIFRDLQGIITNAVAIAAFAGYYLLLKKNPDDDYLPGVPSRWIQRAMLTIAVSLLFISCIFGVNLYFHGCASYVVPNVYHRLICQVFGMVVLVLWQRRTISFANLSEASVFIILFMVFIGSTDSIIMLRNGTLTGTYHWYHMAAHWATSLGMCLIYYKTIMGIRRDETAYTERWMSILLALLPVIYLSMELMHIYVMIGYQKGNIARMELQYGKGGLTTLWGLCSFALMWIGMKYKQKQLRITSLTLFSIVLLKLFIFDISGISEGGKIFAFILLGVLLLTVSFMYQKLKKIIIDDKKE